MNRYQNEVFLKQIGLRDKNVLIIKSSIVVNKTHPGGGLYTRKLALEFKII